MNHRNSTVSKAVKAILMAAPGVMVSPSFAQQATSSQATGQSNEQLEEITVSAPPIRYLPEMQTTATGLSLPLVDTPQSISVITDDMLNQADARTLYDAADLVPGLTQSGYGNGVTFLNLRGQTVNETRINSINFGTQPSLQLVDSYALERVEVVRGPATALYGITGSFGGEINEILKRPQKDFHANFGYEFGDFAEHRYQGDVTGAVPGTDDRLKVRVIGAYTDYGMFQELSIPPHNINKLLAITTSFDITPTTTVSLDFYDEDRNYDATDGCPLAKNQATGELFFPFQIPVEHFYCGDPGHNTVNTRDEFTIGSLSHKFSNGWNFNLNAAYAKSISKLNYVFGFGPAGAFGLSAQDIYLYSYPRNLDDTTQTVNMSLNGPFELFHRTQQFLLALEYQKEDTDQKIYQSYGLGIMNMFQDGGLGILANGKPIPVPPPPNFYNDQLSKSDELRAAAEFLLNPVGNLDVLAGLLAQHTDLTDSSVYVGKTVPSQYGAFNETDVLWRLGLTYRLLSEKGPWLSAANPYFSFSEGFQPNIGIYGINGEPLTDPQRMKMYEVGIKTQWLDSRLTANLALYDGTRTNVPAQIIPPGYGGRVANILEGTNTYKGVEAELIGEVLPGWNQSLTYSFTHYEQETFLFPEQLAVHNVPKNDLAFMNTYEFRSGPLAGLNFSATVIWRDHAPLVDNPTVIYNDHLDPNNQVFVSTTVFNFRVAYRVLTGHFQGVELYSNVSNAFNATYAYSNHGNPGFSNVVMAPRAITGGIRYQF